MSRGLHPAAVAATDRKARRGRSLMERVLIRTPGALAAFSRMVYALPRSRLRTALLEYGYQRAYAAYNRGDWELNTALHDPHDYVNIASDVARIGLDLPSEFHGVDGYLEIQRQFGVPFKDLRIRLETVYELGRNRSAAYCRMTAVGRGSGVPVDNAFLDVHEMRRGRLVRQTAHWDADAGLRSLGISRERPA